MKITKCTSLFLAILILVSNMGMAFSVHFCGGKVAGISSFYNVDQNTDESIHQCCIEKANENKSCCKDKIVKLNKKSDFTSKAFSCETSVAIIIQETKTFYRSFSVGRSGLLSSYYCDANAPPLFKLYSQYIFYA